MTKHPSIATGPCAAAPQPPLQPAESPAENPAARLCSALPHERRVVCRALAYWQQLRGNAPLPAADQAAPGEHPDLSAHFYLIGLAPRWRESVFLYCGSALATLLGHNPAGRRLEASLPHAMGEQMVEFLKGTVQYRQPLADSGSMLRAGGGEMLYRNILLPLSGRSGAVEQVLGAYSYRLVE